MFEDAKEAIKQSSASSSVYIGCDSIRFKRDDFWYARYTVVVIIHKDSCHGGQIFHSTQEMRDFGNIKQRLLTEVQLTSDVATEIIEVLDGRYMEIHLDLNTHAKYKSNAAVKEALGWIKGMTGYDAKCKPDAWAASRAADQCVRGKLQ